MNILRNWKTLLTDKLAERKHILSLAPFFRVSTVVLLNFIMLFACAKSEFKGSTPGKNAEAEAESIAEQEFAEIMAAGALTDTVTLSRAIDLVIAVDTSGSMVEEAAAVQANLFKLIAILEESQLDLKIHLMMAQQANIVDAILGGLGFGTATLPPEIKSDQVFVVANPVGSWDALTQIMRLFKGELNSLYRDAQNQPLANPPALRPDAKLEVLVISDDNAMPAIGPGASPKGGILAKDFDPENKYKSTLSGIVGLSTSPQQAGVCEIAAIGEEYISLAKKTGGSTLDVCAKDWGILIERFSRDVAQRSAAVHLSRVPLDPAQIKVTLDGQLLAAEAWTYRVEDNRVVLNPSTEFKEGAVLNAIYQ